MSENRRVQRVEKELRQIVGQFLTTGVKAPLYGIVSVSRVQVNRDLRNAKVFLSWLGDEDHISEDIDSIRSRSSDMGKEISRRLRMKFCPRLEFLQDESLEKRIKIEKILHEIETNE